MADRAGRAHPRGGGRDPWDRWDPEADRQTDREVYRVSDRVSDRISDREETRSASIRVMEALVLDVPARVGPAARPARAGPGGPIQDRKEDSELLGVS